MKFCTKCGTENPKNQSSCNVCGSLSFCSTLINPNETNVKNETYYIGNVEVTPEQIELIETLIASDQKIQAVKMVIDISGFDLSTAKEYVDNYYRKFP